MEQLALRFSDEDMGLFAAGSGDHSPLHTDPAFARRTPFGGVIVYGGLLSIGLLGRLEPDALARVRSVRSWFPGPVFTGTTYAVRISRRPDGADAWEVKLIGRGKVLARVIADTGREPARPARGEANAAGATVSEYSPGPELHSLAVRFGAAALDLRLLEGIAWASYVVGMGMEGFQGLCAAVRVGTADDEEADGSPCASGAFHVRAHDDRTERRVLAGVLSDGAGAPRTTALIECFSQGTPADPDLAALGAGGLDAPTRGTVAVIGGSRGLGAALALALLTRGYDVHVAYAVSSQSAAELARLAGPLAARLVLHQLDAGDAAGVARLERELRDSDAPPLAGVVLNAAPPPLSMGLSAESGADLAAYVADSVRLVAVPLGSLLPLLDEHGGWVLFCSAAALAAPPRDWPQFVTAKAALEGLAGWVAATRPSASTVVVRSPKMLTDLTNTPSGRNGAAPVEAIATWIVDRLAGDALEPGLSILEHEPVEALPR